METVTSSPSAPAFNVFATPGRRLVAYAIDIGITVFVSWIVARGLGKPSAVFLIATVVQVVYWTGFEASRFRGSPGKVMLGIEVVDNSGKQLSPWRSLGRTIAKLQPLPWRSLLV